MTQGYQMDHSLPLRLFKCVFDNVLLEHGELPSVLLLLSTWTWDTFLTIRGTWGFFLNMYPHLDALKVWIWI